MTIPLKPAIKFGGRPLSEEVLREHGFYVPLYPSELKRVKTFLQVFPGGRCFLVCGKEGVGKTTLVNKALADVSSSSAYDHVIPFRFTPTVPKDTARIIQDIYQALLPLTPARSQPKSFVKHSATIAEALRAMIPGAKIKIVTEVQDRKGGELGVSSTKIQIDGRSGTTVTLELSEENPKSPSAMLQWVINEVTQKEEWARKPFHGFFHKCIYQAKNSVRNIRDWVKGRQNLYVIILDGLNGLEKTPAGDQAIEECLDSLSKCIEKDNSPFKVIAIAGLKTFNKWHDRGAHPAKAFGVDDALYLPCAWERVDLAIKALVEEQFIEGTHKEALDGLSAYLRFFGQGRIATTLLYLEKCCAIEEKKGAQSPRPHVKVDLEILKYVADLQRRIEKEILASARKDFHGVETELDDLMDEVYSLLTDLLRTPVGEYFEYDGQSYSLRPSSVKQAKPRRRAVGYPTYFEKALAILEKTGYIAQDVQIFPEAKKK